jgi:hypothetical protein
MAVSSLRRRNEPVDHGNFGIDCIHHRHERVRRPRLPRACRQTGDLARSCNMFRHVIGRQAVKFPGRLWEVGAFLRRGHFGTRPTIASEANMQSAHCARDLNIIALLRNL